MIFQNRKPREQIERDIFKKFTQISTTPITEVYNVSSTYLYFSLVHSVTVLWILIFDGLGKKVTETVLTTVTLLNTGAWKFLEYLALVGTITAALRRFGGVKHVILKIQVSLSPLNYSKITLLVKKNVVWFQFLLFETSFTGSVAGVVLSRDDNSTSSLTGFTLLYLCFSTKLFLSLVLVNALK